ncbi:hypothetical protein [Chitinibacter sp. GC72]|uniref:hypothetical protein n=1 Tax=Chitinibacter sp. GC72 TaxID=1526917 RepID=UPI0012FBD27D|nr:hypothetical protein [Chitinibacter sp. GC72]
MKTTQLHDLITNALGKPHTSQEVNQLLAYFSLSWQDIRLEDTELYTYSFESKEMSIGLEFEDIAAYFETKNHERGDGPFLLDHFTFWGYGKGFSRSVDLPIANIAFESSVNDVKKTLGPDSALNIDAESPYQWQYTNYKISIHWPFKSKPKEIRNITYWYTPDTQG